MIKSELIENGSRIRHYSDSSFRILQNETGIIYDDAVDAIPCRYTYSETDKPIEIDTGNATVTDYQSALSEFGVKV